MLAGQVMDDASPSMLEASVGIIARSRVALTQTGTVAAHYMAVRRLLNAV